MVLSTSILCLLSGLSPWLWHFWFLWRYLNICFPRSSSKPKPEKILLNLTTVVEVLKFNPSGEALVMASTAKEGAARIVHFPSMTVFENFPASINLARINCVGFRCLVVQFRPVSELYILLLLQPWWWLSQFWQQQRLCFTFQTWPLPFLLNVLRWNNFQLCRIYIFCFKRNFQIADVTLSVRNQVCQTNLQSPNLRFKTFVCSQLFHSD